MKRIRFSSLLPHLLLAGIIALRISFPNLFEGISLKVFDEFQRIKPRTYQDAPVTFLDIDDESLARYGQWPWPRMITGELIERLHKAGAAAIVMDIVFAEPDRTSPKNLLKLWGARPEAESLRAGLGRMPDHDALLAESMRGAHVVSGFILTGDELGRKPAAKAGIAHAGEDPLNYLPSFKGAVTNLPEIEEAAAGNGSFTTQFEKDGIIRRVPLIARYKDTLYPSLTAEAIRVAQGASAIVIKTSSAGSEGGAGAKTGIVSVKIGKLIVPTDAAGRVWLYDTGPVAERTLPAWQVLDNAFDLVRVRDRIVFVGSSAGGLKDIRATPLNPVAAGTEVHIQLTEQVLSGEFLNRPDWAEGAEISYLFLLSLIMILILPRLGALASALLGLITIGAACGFSWYAFTQWHLLLDPVFPSTAAVIIYFVVSLLNFLRTEREKKEVRSAFGRYLSPALVEELAKHPEKLQLGGVTREMSILFSDIRGFTSMSEKMTAEELTRFINRYLTSMTNVILEKNGTIDKYIGDCIMAFWNAPIETPDHARLTCEAALAMSKALAEWNAANSQHPVKAGIGINTGTCSVGNMGSEQRFDYTVLGDEVNLSSRLEGLCKIYDAGIIAGEKTVAAAPHFAWMEIDLIRVKGRTAPSKIFALLGGPEREDDAAWKNLRTLHARFLENYRKGNFSEALNDAIRCQAALSAEWPLEVLYRLYQSRLQLLLKNPLPDWQGVWDAETK